MFESELTALLGRGTKFDGRLLFEGIVRIDGEFVGDIFTRDTVVFGESSKVKAQVDADIVLVGGYFEGDIRATGRVEIQKTGFVKGKVSSPVIRIEEGGLIDGTTQMLPVNT